MQMWKTEIAYDPNSGEKALLFCLFFYVGAF